ncbi:MAG TPA: zinc ribbon domain-containing protein [Leptolyngbyaceae cyanobacterium]
MANCPRCHQPVKTDAVTCPHCRLTLKAFGHPGIPLHRSTGEDYLCDSCAYHDDDTCTLPKRPLARECTLYYDRSQPPEPPKEQPDLGQCLRFWLERNQTWLLLFSLLFISFLLTLRR